MDEMFGSKLIKKLDGLIDKNIQLFTGVVRVEGTLKNRQEVDRYVKYDINENTMLIDPQKNYALVQVNDVGAETVISIYR